MKKYRLYLTSKCAIFEESGTCRIYCDISSNKYYNINCKFYELGISDYSIREYNPQLLDHLVYSLILLILPAFLCLIPLTSKTLFSPLAISWSTALLAVASLVLNIFLHELSHYLSLVYYKLPNGNWGIKKERLRLKFYVDTSSVYLLPTYKQIVVHSVGLLANIYFIFVSVVLGAVSNIPINAIVFPPLALIVLNTVPLFNPNNDITSIIVLLKREL